MAISTSSIFGMDENPFGKSTPVSEKGNPQEFRKIPSEDSTLIQNNTDRYEPSSNKDSDNPEIQFNPSQNQIGIADDSAGIYEVQTTPKETEKPTESDDESEITSGSTNLSSNEEKAVQELKQIDREVRAHEAAHRAAGGSLIRGGASYSYTTGPDGKKYAVGGEVKIAITYDLDDPQKTIQNMEQVRRAALAPADPSAQDRMVATKAAAIEARARSELMKQESYDVKPLNNKKLLNAYQNNEAYQTHNVGNNIDTLVPSTAMESLKK